MNKTLKLILTFIVLASLEPVLGKPTLLSAGTIEGGDKPMDYEKLKIKSYRYWNLYLHENQCYLGRVFVQLKDEKGGEDFLDIQGEAREEFFQIGEKVKNALKVLFKPDKMNYAALSNTSPVIHMHIIPRYKDSRIFHDVTFDDMRWGQNYAPYDRSFVLNESMLIEIKNALADHL